MPVRILCSGSETALGRFIEGYVGNVCRGIVASLKTEQPAESILMELDGDAVRLYLDGRPVSLDDNQGFATVIIRETLRGMIGKLKGIAPGGTVRIEVDLTRTERS